MRDVAVRGLQQFLGALRGLDTRLAEGGRNPSPSAGEAVTFLLLCVALGAGLAAAYGRELQAGRRPDCRWWLARVLLLPLLAISAATASEAFGLSRSVTAFTAAMLSLGGYDCLRLIEARWGSRILAATGEQRSPEARRAEQSATLEQSDER